MTLVRSSSPTSLLDMTDEALRVRAVRAAADSDVDDLLALLDAYLLGGSKRGARLSPKTRAAYALAARDFVGWAGAAGVSLLRPGRRDGGRYVAHLQTRPNRGRGRHQSLSAATVAQYVAGARALYRALRWAGATTLDPFADVTPPPDPTPGIVKNPPYHREVEDALAFCDEPLAALLLLCAHGGLRVSEALALTAADVTNGRLQVHGKGGKLRVVPLSQRAREALARVVPQPDGRFFAWNYAAAAYRLRKAFRAAGHGPAWRGFHAARKASGTRLYHRTKDFTRVGLFLGHASVDTTRRYVQVPDDDVAHLVEDF